MEHRVSSMIVNDQPTVSDLAENETPPLPKSTTAKHTLEPSAESTDSCDFSEIGRRMGRIGGESPTPDVATGHQFKHDAEIRMEHPLVTPSFSEQGYGLPRAPITETVTWDDPPSSAEGFSAMGRRRSAGFAHSVRVDSDVQSKRKGKCIVALFSEEEEGATLIVSDLPLCRLNPQMKGRNRVGKRTSRYYANF